MLPLPPTEWEALTTTLHYQISKMLLGKCSFPEQCALFSVAFLPYSLPLPYLHQPLIVLARLLGANAVESGPAGVARSRAAVQLEADVLRRKLVGGHGDHEFEATASSHDHVVGVGELGGVARGLVGILHYVHVVDHDHRHFAPKHA